MESPEVVKQYSKWVYPLPVEDLEEDRKTAMQTPDPALFFNLYWPGRSIQELDILIAGCGTNQAAQLAYTNPKSTLTGIDISKTSIEHTLMLKEKHKMDNLTVHNMSLFDVESLNHKFDLIISTGVLHHLPDPVAGAKALKSVLKEDGVMHLMLYGKTLRAGVYMLQEAFRAMGLEQTQEDVDLIKGMLPHLPKKHAIKKYFSVAHDLKYDAGIVDTLLHRQDTAYSVEEIYQFAEQVGLKFRGWLDNGTFCPANYFKPDFPGWDKLKAMSEKEQAIFVDNFLQRTGTHRFNLCHPEVNESTYKITFDGTQWKKYTPILRKPIKVLQQADWKKKKKPKVQRGPHVFELDQAATMLMESVDGKRTISECTKRAFAKVKKMPLPPEQIAHKFFKGMWEKGHLFFRKP